MSLSFPILNRHNFRKFLPFPLSHKFGFTQNRLSCLYVILYGSIYKPECLIYQIFVALHENIERLDLQTFQSETHAIIEEMRTREGILRKRHFAIRIRLATDT